MLQHWRRNPTRVHRGRLAVLAAERLQTVPGREEKTEPNSAAVRVLSETLADFIVQQVEPEKFMSQMPLSSSAFGQSGWTWIRVGDRPCDDVLDVRILHVRAIGGV